MVIYHPDDICATCGHPFSDHGGFYEPLNPMELEEPYRSHIDCKKLMGTDQYGYATQCECCNFIPR